MGIIDDLGKRVGEWIGVSDDDVPFDDMRKAMEEGGLAEPTEEKPRALFHDPYSVMDWGGWRQRPSSMTYETLRNMSVQNTVIAAILQLRTNQIAQFARPQQGAYDKGYRVQLRDRRDNSKSMTPIESAKAAELEAMLENTGYLLPGERASDRDNFRTFVKKSVRDVLTYDQWCFEKIRDRSGRVSRFICLPGETIRPAVADVEHMTPEQMRGRVSHVQVYDSTVIAEFGVDDLAWNIMNPRSDLRSNGFGFAPTEQILRLVTAWLYGFEYNARFFTQGSAIKGILNIKGAIPDRQLRAFRRMWYAMVAGVQNSWKTPILNSEDIQWHSMHSTNREMEYAGWMDWITKLTCAVYGIDPLEINFIFNAGGRGGGFNSRPNANEVSESKDKGLFPLADHISDAINQHMIWELVPEFEFSFTGLDAKAETKERERRKDAVEKWMTVNEIRAELDMTPDPNGDIILNPTYLQYLQGKAAQAGAGGDPNAELGEGESDGSEDQHDAQSDTDSMDPAMDAPDNDGEDYGGDDSYEKSQSAVLAATVHARGTVETLRKAIRVDKNGQQHIDIDWSK